jgi:hypothetical protein
LKVEQCGYFWIVSQAVAADETRPAELSVG